MVQRPGQPCMVDLASNRLPEAINPEVDLASRSHGDQVYPCWVGLASVVWLEGGGANGLTSTHSLPSECTLPPPLAHARALTR